MINALRRQVQWVSHHDSKKRALSLTNNQLSIETRLNLWKRWHPVRPFMHWYNSKIMSSFMKKALKKRFDAYTRQANHTSNKSVIDRSIWTYLNDVFEDAVTSPTIFMTAASKELIMEQMKLFMFSDHDTTSASVCWSLYLLFKSLTDLDRIRAEHDKVFGISWNRISAMISKDLHLLNQVPFTLAVIKETLRLFPIASNTRSGEPGFSMMTENDRAYPTEECFVWSSPHMIQRPSDFWSRSDEFISNRWLVSPGDDLHPIKKAWRPFELELRNCIEQKHAVLEMKIVMVLVIRQFDFSIAYDEGDQLHPKKTPKHVTGERAYQAPNERPSEGMPCRVKLRDFVLVASWFAVALVWTTQKIVPAIMYLKFEWFYHTWMTWGFRDESRVFPPAVKYSGNRCRTCAMTAECFSNPPIFCLVCLGRTSLMAILQGAIQGDQPRLMAMIFWSKLNHECFALWTNIYIYIRVVYSIKKQTIMYVRFGGRRSMSNQILLSLQDIQYYCSSFRWRRGEKMFVRRKSIIHNHYH